MVRWEFQLNLILLLSTSSYERFIGNDTVKSKIEIDPATQMDAGIYECTADNQYSELGLMWNYFLI